jgi:hypothetical protein
MPGRHHNTRKAASKAKKNKVQVPRAVEDIEPTSDELDYSEEEDFSDEEYTDEQLAEIGIRKVKPKADGKTGKKEDTPPVASKPSASSAAPNYSSDNSSTTRQAFPFDLLVTLVSDIQAAGGISVFHIASADSQVVASLCDTRPELYGRRADPLRRRIRKKIWKWHQDYKQDPKSWVQVLSKFKCTEKAAKCDPKLYTTKEPKESAVEADKKPAAVPVKPAAAPPVPYPTFTSAERQVGSDTMDTCK